MPGGRQFIDYIYVEITVSIIWGESIILPYHDIRGQCLFLYTSPCDHTDVGKVDASLQSHCDIIHIHMYMYNLTPFPFHSHFATYMYVHVHVHG